MDSHLRRRRELVRVELLFQCSNSIEMGNSMSNSVVDREPEVGTKEHESLFERVRRMLGAGDGEEREHYKMDPLEIKAHDAAVQD